MRIKRTEVKVYPFDELSDDAKEKAVAGLYDINIWHDWWEGIFDDALSARLKLTEFDIDRGSYCHGEFIENAEDTAAAILENHGESCETHKTAMGFMEESGQLLLVFPVKLDDDENEMARENEQEEIDAEFLKSILEDYRIILQKEYEYLATEAVIIETIEANEYEFTEDGVLA